MSRCLAASYGDTTTESHPLCRSTTRTTRGAHQNVEANNPSFSSVLSVHSANSTSSRLTKYPPGPPPYHGAGKKGDLGASYLLITRSSTWVGEEIIGEFSTISFLLQKRKDESIQR